MPPFRAFRVFAWFVFYVGGYYEVFYPAGGAADAGGSTDVNPGLHAALSAALGGEPEPGEPPSVVTADPGLLLMAPALGMLLVLNRRKKRRTRARRTLAWSVGNVLLAVAIVSILVWFTVKPALAAGPEVTKYYYAGAQRVAMRRSPAGSGDGAVTYLHGDHLGSTSLTTDAGGQPQARVLYYPYGETRYAEGTLQTDYQYTGQRNEQGIGLMDYNARYYDPALGRFISADTIVPNPANPQSLNRYAYVLGNPLKYTDPSGHYSPEEIEQFCKDNYGDEWGNYYYLWQAKEDFWNVLLAAEAGDVLYVDLESGLGSGYFSRTEDGKMRFDSSSAHGLEKYFRANSYRLNRPVDEDRFCPIPTDRLTETRNLFDSPIGESDWVVNEDGSEKERFEGLCVVQWIELESVDTSNVGKGLIDTGIKTGAAVVSWYRRSPTAPFTTAAAFLAAANTVPDGTYSYTLYYIPVEFFIETRQSLFWCDDSLSRSPRWCP